MTVLKFECPSCNQHMECDRVLSGDIIHCPRCCAELRIPFESTAHIEGTVARAELVNPAATAPAPAQAQDQKQDLPKAPKEITCPVCSSELRVPSAESPTNAPPVAVLVRKAPEKAAAAPPPSDKPKPPPEHTPVSLEERERQIAAAREAHPVQANPPLKPRMDFVRTGEAEVPTDSSKPAEVKRSPDKKGGPAKSLSE